MKTALYLGLIKIISNFGRRFTSTSLDSKLGTALYFSPFAGGHTVHELGTDWGGALHEYVTPIEVAVFDPSTHPVTLGGVGQFPWTIPRTIPPPVLGRTFLPGQFPPI